MKEVLPHTRAVLIALVFLALHTANSSSQLTSKTSSDTILPKTSSDAILPKSRRVVMIPTTVTSAALYYTNVGRALRRLGHQVWICIPRYMLRSGHINTTDLNVIIYGEDYVDDFYEHEDALLNMRPSTFYLKTLLEDSERLSKSVFKDNTFERTIMATQADLFVLDTDPFVRELLVISYKLNMPFALMGIMHDVCSARVPFVPSLLPSSFDEVGEMMDFWQRVKTVLFYLDVCLLSPMYDNSVVAKFAPEKPFVTARDLAAQAEIFIFAYDHILDYPRPSLTNTKFVGGLAQTPAQPLQEPFLSFADSAESGLIIATFGSEISNLPDPVFQKMAKAFQEMTVKVVWRVNRTSPDPTQILTSMWIPQSDLLGHRNTRLFVSHCGKNGRYEALYHAVPMLCLPVLFDQTYNAELILIKQFGLRADVQDVSSDHLLTLMTELMTNSTYKNNMLTASRLYKTFFKTPAVEAAFWLDHVMEFGGNYMRARSQKVPFYQFLMLDIFAFVFVVTISILIVLLLLLYLTLRCCYHVVRYKVKVE